MSIKITNEVVNKMKNFIIGRNPALIESSHIGQKQAVYVEKLNHLIINESFAKLLTAEVIEPEEILKLDWMVAEIDQPKDLKFEFNEN